MTFLSVENIAKTYGSFPVFSGVGFTLAAGARAALFGPNGCGKTTVLRMIAGELAPDEGQIRLAPGLRLGYLPQTPAFPPGATLDDVLAEAAAAGCGRSVGEALGRFGFDRSTAGRPVHLLSSGQRTRAALACLWLREPDLLLLDEPTNHLDLPGLDLLGDFLRAFRGAFLLVSHDRYLIDQAARDLIELSPTGARVFPSGGTGAYTAYRRQKELEFQTQSALHERQVREERRLEQRLAEQMEWFRQAHRDADHTEMRSSKWFYRAKAKKMARRAKAVVARLERLRTDKVERPRAAVRPELAWDDPERSGRRLILAEGLRKSYARELFGGLHLGVLRGDRVGIIGPNGCGKTTLLRLLLGLEAPDGGTVWRSPALRPAYLDQELARLPLDETVLDCVAAATDRPADEVRLLLGCLLFRGDAVTKRVSDLSRGERVRVALARLLLSGANLLVLDEPTNHLDIQAREAVEGSLAAYGGTLLLVSHDRYLLARVCTKIAAFHPGKGFAVFGGTYREYEAGRAPAGKGAPLSAEDRLLLGNRLSVLAARLGKAFADEAEKAATVREFDELAARLGTGRLPPR